jgi:hypothetical protein
MTSALRTDAMIAIIDQQSIPHSQKVGISIIYLGTTFHSPNFSDSLVITIKLKS